MRTAAIAYCMGFGVIALVGLPEAAAAQSGPGFVCHVTAGSGAAGRIYYTGWIPGAVPNNLGPIREGFLEYLRVRHNAYATWSNYAPCTSGYPNYAAVQRHQAAPHVIFTDWTTGAVGVAQSSSQNTAAGGGSSSPQANDRNASTTATPQVAPAPGPSAERQRANVNPVAQEAFERRRRALESARRSYSACMARIRAEGRRAACAAQQ
jgi:hypothetical protein